MKKNMKAMAAVVVAIMLVPVLAVAQGADTRNQGYLVDTYGNNVTMSGSNLCWRDSDWTPARAVELCDPVNKPVAAAPAAKPVAVAAVAPAPDPVKPLPQKISFSGDALFAFDKSVLKPEGKAMLDGMASQLGGATYDNIIVTGHTDRFGSNAYNQKLSERRANAVKDYLVSKNVQASRIDAQGRGETQPETKTGDCRGAKSARVIACLQPDRRVDVEMKGTKTVTGSR